MARLRISFPGVQVLSRPLDGGELHGFFVAKGGWEGWDDGVVGVRDSVSRPGQHGVYDLPVLREARVVTLRGHAFARSEFDLGGFRDALMGVGADGGSVPMSVAHLGQTLRADVRVLSASFEDAGLNDGRSRAEFTLHLECADPRKYGERRTFSGGTVDVHHMGNFPASPVVTITGPRAAPYTITGPGNRVVQVNQALTSGQTHRIDFRTGRVFRNNALQVGVLGQAGFWAIPPGKTSVMELSQGGSMTVALDDTYM
ncbi:hypothetical protein ACXR2W_00765 [Leucobacter sp. HY1908]